MQCPRCFAENRDGSNFCRNCSAPLTLAAEAPPEPDSGYIPSVPPSNANSFGTYYPPSAPPPLPQAIPRPANGKLVCPRCGSTSVLKGGIPVWAIICSVVGFLFVLCFSLLFLLVREPNKCLHCGLEFK
ncbi:MAG: hypothetical protein DMF61_25975 [Blastocatellia bacterium AA13]|nr:MAG: hypothetical protein DMF61_25975 [Blastocatellia bacterium AA13]